MPVLRDYTFTVHPLGRYILSCVASAHSAVAPRWRALVWHFVPGLAAMHQEPGSAHVVAGEHWSARNLQVLRLGQNLLTSLLESIAPIHHSSGLWPGASAVALAYSVIVMLRHTLPLHRIGVRWFGTSCRA